MQEAYQQQPQAASPQDFSHDMNKSCSTMKIVSFILFVS